MSKQKSNSCWELKVLLSEIIRWFEILLFMIKWAFVRITTRIPNSYSCLLGKTAIVTGGSSGIGLATASLLASRGCRVIIASRRASEKCKNIIIRKTNNPNIVTKSLDLTSLKSVRDFACDIKETETKIDILINNAGISASAEKCTKDGLNGVMQTNFFGAFLLTHLLLDTLKASGSAKIVFTSSVLAAAHRLEVDSLNPTHYEHIPEMTPMLYSNSKLCNILAAQEFAKRLDKYGITVVSVDPGVSTTPIFDFSLDPVLSPNLYTKVALAYLLLYKTDEFTGAEGNIYVTTSDQVKTGKHYFRCIPFIKPWICNNQILCDQIWKQSEELVRLKSEEKLAVY